MAQQITENMIREAAYFLWEKAGRPDGSAEYFWMKACEQFFKPKKVEIKKPATKTAKKAQPKKVTVKPAKKSTPAKKAVVPAKKVAAPVKKPTVKVLVKPITTTAKPVKKVIIKVQSKPTTKTEKATTVPFYGSRK